MVGHGRAGHHWALFITSLLMLGDPLGRLAGDACRKMWGSKHISLAYSTYAPKGLPLPPMLS